MGEQFNGLIDELRGVSVITGNAQITDIANNLALAFQNGTKFKALIDALKNNGNITSESELTTTKLRDAIGTDASSGTDVKNAIAALVLAMYGATVNEQSGTKHITASNSGASNPVEVTIGGSKQFAALVEKFKEDTNIKDMKSVSAHNQVADKIKAALYDQTKVKPALLDLIKSMVGEKASKVSSVGVESENTNVNVKINSKETNELGSAATVEVTIKSSGSEAQNIQIQVKGETTDGFTEHEGTAIAKVLALAVGHTEVAKVAKSGSEGSITAMSASVQSTIDGDAVTVKSTPQVKLQVKLHRSLLPGKDTTDETKVATNIAKKIALALVSDEINNTFISYTINY